MARHKCTMDNWNQDGKTWLWFEGKESDLIELRETALGQFPGKVECGHPEVSGESWAQGNNLIHYMAFVFIDAKDAMFFKLSN